MAIDFPNTPILGDTFVGTNGGTYYYDGEKWVLDSSKVAQVSAIVAGDTQLQVSDTGTGVANIIVDGTLVANVTAASGLQVKSNLFTILDAVDVTKKVVFGTSLISTGTTRTYTFPDAVGGIITFADTATTLSNKTLDNTNTITVRDANLTIQDNVDTTKQMRFELTNISTATTRTLSVPDANGEIVLTNATQTLSNKTLTTTNFYSISDSNLELVKASDNSVKAKFSLELLGPGFPGEFKAYILPNANATLVGDNIAQTLIDKTLSSANLTGITSFGRNAITQPKLVDPSVVSVALGTLSTGTTVINLANGSHFTATISSGANVTFSLAALSGLTNQAVAWTMEIANATVGTINWFTGTKWPGGTAPFSNGPVDVYTFITSDGGTTIRGVRTQEASA